MKKFEMVYPTHLDRYLEIPWTAEYDSSDRIQKALDRMGKRGGGLVMLARGGYFITKTLTVPKNVTLSGMDREGTLLFVRDKDGDKWNVIECESFATVRDLRIRIEGRHATVIKGARNLTVSCVSVIASPYLKPYVCYGLGLDGAHMITAEGGKVLISDFYYFGKGHGIEINGADSVLVEDLRANSPEAALTVRNCKTAVARGLLLMGKSEKCTPDEPDEDGIIRNYMKDTKAAAKMTAACVCVFDNCKNVDLSDIDVRDARAGVAGVTVKGADSVRISDVYTEAVEHSVKTDNCKDVIIEGVTVVRGEGVCSPDAKASDVITLY